MRQPLPKFGSIHCEVLRVNSALCLMTASLSHLS